MELGAGRAYSYDALDSAWDRLQAGAELDRAHRVSIALSGIHAFHTAREVVQSMVDTAGTTAIYSTSPLDRLLRDSITICQHVVAQERMLEMVGGMVVGQDSAIPFI